MNFMPMLKQGSTGPVVQAVQQKLMDLGFDPNGVDGRFGPGTMAAVIAFQRSKGLQPDGIVGPLTLAALQPGGSNAGPATAGALNLAGLTGYLPAAVIAQIPETASKFGITTNL